jgi:hypothetical protein
VSGDVVTAPKTAATTRGSLGSAPLTFLLAVYTAFSTSVYAAALIVGAQPVTAFGSFQIS